MVGENAAEPRNMSGPVHVAAPALRDRAIDRLGATRPAASGFKAKTRDRLQSANSGLSSSFPMAVNNTSIVEFVATDKQAGDVRMA